MEDLFVQQHNTMYFYCRLASWRNQAFLPAFSWKAVYVAMTSIMLDSDGLDSMLRRPRGLQIRAVDLVFVNRNQNYPCLWPKLDIVHG